MFVLLPDQFRLFLYFTLIPLDRENRAKVARPDPGRAGI